MVDTYEENPFLEGIKFIIKTQFPSQKDFAKGVTSNVNLSNVLRGKGGTSEDMRKRLAQRANMSVEEVIAQGKKTLASLKNDTDNTGPLVVEATPRSFVDRLPEMSASEIISNVNATANKINSQLLSHTQLMNSVVTTLIAERDKLIAALHKEQSMLNSMADCIKLVNTKYEITHCNRAYTERHMLTPGDSIHEEEDKAATHMELITKTFKTGTSGIALIRNSEGKMESIMTYPQYYQDGSINGVLVVNRIVHKFEEFLDAMGYVKKQDAK